MPDVAYRPRLVFWELTRGCNLRCIHCRASATELSSPDDLNYEESAWIIDQLAAYAPLILVLSGGEPLFRRDVFQLARRATSLGIRVALGTNGTMITADVAREISEAGIRRVAISLDGPDAATHDSFRGIPGAFEKAIEGFEHLKRLGMSVQINTSVAKHNAAKLPETLDLALRLGADAFHLFLLVPVGCGVQIADKQMVEAEEYEQILNWLYDRTLENRIELKATCDPQLEAGSLHRQSFTEVWETSPLFASLRDLGNLKGKCGICEFRNICEGCRARAFGCTGDYLAEEPFCLYTPRGQQPPVSVSAPQPPLVSLQA